MECAKVLERLPDHREVDAQQADAGAQSVVTERLVSTDPPYYDNIGYADLSDFFYVWLRRSLRPVFPDLSPRSRCPKPKNWSPALPPRQQGESRGVLPRRDDAGDAPSRGAAHPAFRSPSTTPSSSRRRRRRRHREHWLGDLSRRRDPRRFRDQRHLADAD